MVLEGLIRILPCPSQIHGRANIEFIKCSTLYLTSERVERVRYGVEYEKRNLRATMYYFVYYIYILLTRRSRLNSPFKRERVAIIFI